MPNSSSRVTTNSLGATAVLLVGHAATLVDFHGINTTGSAAYVQMFNAATAAGVTVGTTIPDRVLTLAASGSATDSIGGDGIDFSLGIVVASTTTATGSTGATTHVRIGVR